VTGWLPQTVSGRIYAALLLLLAVAPFVLQAIEQPFYLDLLSRALIFAIAVVSLNLILGYGGMVSLGHAAYIGIGAYSVGIASYYDYYNGWLHLAIALGVSGLFALVTGAISLRTKGVYFIMITMAFSQMVFFIFLSLEEYGADDGLVIYTRSEFPEPQGDILEQVNQLGIPVGWTTVSPADGQQCGWMPGQPEYPAIWTNDSCQILLNLPRMDDGWGWLQKFFGLLISGIAAAQGAPFWFQMLNKVFNFRSSGRVPKTTRADHSAAE